MKSSTTERKALASVLAIKKHERYLDGKQDITITGHRPLTTW